MLKVIVAAVAVINNNKENGVNKDMKTTKHACFLVHADIMIEMFHLLSIMDECNLLPAGDDLKFLLLSVKGESFPLFVRAFLSHSFIKSSTSVGVSLYSHAPSSRCSDGTGTGFSSAIKHQ